ncbi:NAD(P)H-dependent flavin oxidoreductase [Sphingomonas sp.]|uniref:NAD(P)H-dependent flavin oxidoreductase n=1 Tax=Sphingomonas sp. TaxID=28214 RepID=UPI003B3AC300
MTATWRDRRLLDLFGIETPIVQAPMAAAQDAALAIAAIRAGALGSLPCALLTPDAVRAQVADVRAAVTGPLNLNFFCHSLPGEVDDRAWRAALQPYYREYGAAPPLAPPPLRQPFDEAMAALVADLRPQVVSFHFGLPDAPLLERVRSAGCRIIASANSPAEARWLADRGVDAVIAQGWEAGGHATCFLPADSSTRMGLFALVPQIVDAVDVPVIAAGGIADARGIAAAMMLGASGVQMGTAFLATPNSRISQFHRDRLGTEAGEVTVVTNLFTGRPARGLQTRLTRELGPTNPIVPPFPHGGDALAELRAHDPANFAAMWAGQAAAMVRPEGTERLIRRLTVETLDLLK